MEKLLTGAFMVLALIFFMPLFGTLMGAFSGWVVGLFFTETILGFLERAGVRTIGIELWEVGAAMGFLGGFLKTATTTVAK